MGRRGELGARALAERALGFEAAERSGTLVFRMTGEESVHVIPEAAVNLDEFRRIEAITDRGAARHLLLSADVPAMARARAGSAGNLPVAAPVFPQADIVVMDAPAPAGGV